MMNNVCLTGRLTRDPELRYSPNGTAVCNFTLAVNRSFTNQDGEREADFPQVVAFKGTAESIGNYMRKGSMVAVEGRLQTRSYEKEDPAGNYMVYVTEVVANQVHFLEKKEESGNNNTNSNRRSGSRGGRR